MTAAVPGNPHVNIDLRAIRVWLFIVAAMVLAMVLVGGATRLTESGLSITQWQPVVGVAPPLNAAQWQAEFARYQAIPQYHALNPGMSLDQFKTIFWWEWTHRLIGRAIGFVFLLPLLWFLWRGWIGPGLRARLWLIFGLGALQGAVGWWMVASGLAHRVEVSQYRLATHLLLACLIYVAIVWTALRLGERKPAPAPASAPARVRIGAVGLLILVLAQIYLGALVAGLRAGYIYNTWPLIDGAFVPDFSATVRRRAAVAQFLRKYADRAIRPPHARLHDLDLCAAPRSRRRSRAKKGQGARRRSRVVRRCHGTGGARHLDAVAGGAAAAVARTPGHGDGGADSCYRARGVRHSGAERSEEPGTHNPRSSALVAETINPRRW